VGLVAGEQVSPHQRRGVELDRGRRGQQRRQGDLQPDQPRAEAEGEEVQRPLLDVGVGEAAAALAANQLGLHAEVAGDGGHVRPRGFEELGLLGRDGDGLEAGAVTQDGNLAVALVGGLPSFLEFAGAAAVDALVGGQQPRRDGGVAEEAGRVLLGGQPEADRLAGVADGGQAEDLAGGGERPDVPDRRGVDLLAVDAVLDDAVGHGDGDPVVGDQLDLTREESRTGAVDHQAVGVPLDEERLQGGVQEVGQAPAGRRLAEDGREVGKGVALALAVGRQGKGRDGAGDEVDARPDGRVLHGAGRGDGDAGGDRAPVLSDELFEGQGLAVGDPGPDVAVPPAHGLPLTRWCRPGCAAGKLTQLGRNRRPRGDEGARPGAEVLALDEGVLLGHLGRGGRPVAYARDGLADPALEVGAFLGQLDVGLDVAVEVSLGHARTPRSTTKADGWASCTSARR